MSVKVDYMKCYWKASEIFLTDRIPIELLEKADETGEWLDIDNFIRANIIEALEHQSLETIWELIEDTGRMIASNYVRGINRIEL